MDIDNVVRARDVAVTQLFGEITITGASGAISTATPSTCYGFTVAYVSAGKYTITLDRLYPELLYVNASTFLATVTEVDAQVSAYDMSAGTISVIFTTSGAATELATGSKVFFMIVLKDSTVAP